MAEREELELHSIGEKPPEEEPAPPGSFLMAAPQRQLGITMHLDPDDGLCLRPGCDLPVPTGHIWCRTHADYQSD